MPINHQALMRSRGRGSTVSVLFSLLMVFTTTTQGAEQELDTQPLAEPATAPMFEAHPPADQSKSLVNNLSEHTPHWLGTPPKQVFAKLIESHFAAREQSPQLNELLLSSPNTHSRALFSKLMEYTLLTEAGYWCAVPIDAQDYLAVRYQLWLRGDLQDEGLTLGQAVQQACSPGLQNASLGTSNPSTANQFDDDMGGAISRLQSRHGLEPSGKLDAETLRVLQINPNEQLHQLRVNLKRIRTLEIPTENDTYLVANIPAFRVSVYENGRPALELNAVVGKKSRPTPEFSASLRTIVVNPRWNIPSKLMYRDVIPKQIKDPDYLTERGIRIISKWGADDNIDPTSIDWKAVRWNFPFRMSQQPGPRNALGQFKFLTPNQRAIYLHDTNAKALFQRKIRAFSSGCVRLEHPEKLVAYLLERNEETYDVDELLEQGNTRYLSLSNPPTVHYVYWTAWVDKDGKLQLRDDIYAKDTTPNKPLQLASANSTPAAQL